jgi:hypothetical protein
VDEAALALEPDMRTRPAERSYLASPEFGELLSVRGLALTGAPVPGPRSGPRPP